MKTKIALPIVAFAIAIVGAFSTYAKKALVNINPDEYKPVSACLSCSALTGDFDCTTVSAESIGVCQCTIPAQGGGTQTVSAFNSDGGSCVALFKHERED